MVTIDDLKRRRAGQPDSSTMAILLDDLIERREAAYQVDSDVALLAECRTDVARAGAVEVVTLTHLPTGMAFARPTRAGALVALRRALAALKAGR